MGTFRINRNENYCILSNYHLKDTNLSLLSKGTLTLLLTYPQSININDKETKSALKELEQKNYIKSVENGNFEVFERPFYQVNTILPRKSIIKRKYIYFITNNIYNYILNNINNSNNIYYALNNNLTLDSTSTSIYDNINYTYSKSFTINNTSINLYFNRNINVIYKVPTIPGYINVKYKVLTKEKRKENNNTNLHDIKEKKKENPEVQEIFDFYQNCGLKKMRTFTDKAKNAIKKALKEYTKAQLCEMILRFKCMIYDEFYFYSYKWNVEEFFSRKDGYRTFADDGEKWINYTSKRPIVKTEQYFKPLWDMYPNKYGERDAREAFQNKFVGLNTEQALERARVIYKKCKDYVDDTDDKYIKQLKNWLNENV